VTQRVKDPERFVAELERPLGGGARTTVTTDRDLEQDGSNFMAFAAMMGVKPPVAESGDPVAVPSA
jgi:hypothetical protein